jgi:4-amino-4-deoxy-L-arabinose transferase-like glycosyltransferase
VLALAFLRLPLGLDDMFQYDMLARALAAGQGYRWYGREDVARLRPYLQQYYGIDLPLDQVPPEGFETVFRAPGYPFFLAAIYSASGLDLRLPATRLIQSLISAGLAPLAALLGLRLGLNRRAAVLGGILVAAYPILWIYPIGLASENLFLPLVLVGLLFLLTPPPTGRDLSPWAAGLSLGLATLTRGALAAFLPVAALWIGWPLAVRSQAGRARLRRALSFIATGSAVLIPWALRNSLILGRPAFVENSAGYNLFVGYHPEGDGGLTLAASVIPLQILDDAERDRWTTSQAWGFIRDDPVRALTLAPRRLAYFWGLEDRELVYFYSNDYLGPLQQPWLGLAYLGLVLPLVILGLTAPWGMAWSPERRARALSLGLVVASLAAYVPILAEPRFHLPLIPVLAAYAGSALSTSRAGRRVLADLRLKRRASWLALFAGILLLVLWTWDTAHEWPELQAVMAPGGHQLHLDY